MDNELEIQRSLGRIEGGISELKSSVDLIRQDHAGLRAEFNKLEAGRLTRLESAFAVQQTEIKIKARNTAIWMSAVISLGVSILSAILIKYVI